MSMSRTQRSIRLHIAAGVGVAILLVGGVGGWAATSELAGAVIAAGQIVVDTECQKSAAPDRRHRQGAARPQRATASKPAISSIRLDDTQIRASLEMVRHSLDELTSRRARDEAERDGAAEVAFPQDLVGAAKRSARRGASSRASGSCSRPGAPPGRDKGATARADRRTGRADRGTKEQLTAKDKEIEWVRQELKGTRELWQKNLIPDRAADRDRARGGAPGRRPRCAACPNRAEPWQSCRNRAPHIQIDEDLRTEVSKDLAENLAPRLRNSPKGGSRPMISCGGSRSARRMTASCMSLPCTPSAA